MTNETIRILNEPGKRVKAIPTSYIVVQGIGKKWSIKLEHKTQSLSWTKIHAMGKEQHADYPFKGDKTYLYEMVNIYEYAE